MKDNTSFKGYLTESIPGVSYAKHSESILRGEVTPMGWTKMTTPVIFTVLVL